MAGALQAGVSGGTVQRGLRRAGLQVVICVLFLWTGAASLPAEEAGALDDGPGTDSYDIYYDAMLRSIELDMSRWKSFSRSMESGPWFYDAGSLKRNGGRVTVRVAVYPHPQRTELYRSVHPEHTKIRKIEFTTEIDCPKRGFRQPLIRVFGYERQLLAEHASDAGTQPFAPIKPGTTTDTLRGNVCPPERKKR